MERIVQTSLLGTSSISHREYGTDLFRQFREAITHHLPELGTMHHLIRLGFPFMRPEVMIPETDRYELFRKLIRKKFHVGERCLSSKFPKMITILFFRMPTSQLRSDERPPNFS